MDPERTSTPAEAVEEAPPKGISSGVKIGAVIALLGAALAAILLGSSASDAFVYSKLVDEVMTKPAEFAGRELRVEGDLKPGSIQFREEPCEYRFTVQKSGKEMPVQFAQCVVPDTFRDGMGISVVVQGKLTKQGDSFVASQVIPRCPSKYEMQQKKQNGEVMPHAQPLSNADQLQ
jgi:cytochrome c-type biogenesis protein CcmE